MKIQILSDIHIEFTHEFSQMSKSIKHTFEFIPKTESDVIILAGDIWYQHYGLNWSAELSQLHDKAVIVIFGNHDYWSVSKSTNRGVNTVIKDMYAIAEKCRTKDIQLYFLENDALILNGVRFLGCTLWTDYNQGDDQTMLYCKHNMSDHMAICGESMPQHIYQKHLESRAWLENELTKKHNVPTVVITHHAPSSRSLISPPSKNGGVDYAYFSNLESLIYKYSPDLWLHGHIHKTNDYMIDCTRVVSNARGYHGQQTIEHFDPGLIIEI